MSQEILDKMTKDERDKYSLRKMEEMKKKNELFKKRYEEVQADKFEAENCNSSVTAKLPKNFNEDRTKVVCKKTISSYNEWKAERQQIDQERIDRIKDRREWDYGKNEKGLNYCQDKQDFCKGNFYNQRKNNTRENRQAFSESSRKAPFINEDRGNRFKEDKGNRFNDSRGNMSKEDHRNWSKESRGDGIKDQRNWIKDNRGSWVNKDRGYWRREDKDDWSSEPRGNWGKKEFWSNRNRGNWSKEDKGNWSTEDKRNWSMENRGNWSKEDRGNRFKEVRENWSEETKGNCSKEGENWSEETKGNWSKEGENWSKEDRGNWSKEDRGNRFKEVRENWSEETKGNWQSESKRKRSTEDRRKWPGENKGNYLVANQNNQAFDDQSPWSEVEREWCEVDQKNESFDDQSPWSEVDQGDWCDIDQRNIVTIEEDTVSWADQQNMCKGKVNVSYDKQNVGFIDNKISKKTGEHEKQYATWENLPLKRKKEFPPLELNSDLKVIADEGGNKSFYNKKSGEKQISFNKMHNMNKKAQHNKMHNMNLVSRSNKEEHCRSFRNDFEDKRAKRIQYHIYKKPSDDEDTALSANKKVERWMEHMLKCGSLRFPKENLPNQHTGHNVLKDQVNVTDVNNTENFHEVTAAKDKDIFISSPDGQNFSSKNGDCDNANLYTLKTFCTDVASHPKKVRSVTKNKGSGQRYRLRKSIKRLPCSKKKLASNEVPKCELLNNAHEGDLKSKVDSSIKNVNKEKCTHFSQKKMKSSYHYKYSNSRSKNGASMYNKAKSVFPGDKKTYRNITVNEKCSSNSSHASSWATILDEKECVLTESEDSLALLELRANLLEDHLYKLQAEMDKDGK